MRADSEATCCLRQSARMRLRRHAQDSNKDVSRLKLSMTAHEHEARACTHASTGLRRTSMACKPRCINIIFGGRVWLACLRVLATSRLRCCVAVPVVSLACIGTKSSEYHAQPPQDDFESPEMALGVRVCKSSDDFESPEMALGVRVC